MSDFMLSDEFRELTGTPLPTEGERAEGLRVLRAEMEAADLLRPRRRRGRLIPALAAGLVIVLIAVGSLLVRTESATAELLVLAEASRRTSSVDTSGGGAVFTSTEGFSMAVIPGSRLDLPDPVVAYLIKTRVEMWLTADGVGFIRTETGSPTFFSDEVRDAYEQVGYAADDGVGTVIEEWYENVNQPGREEVWSEDPAALRAEMEERIQTSGRTATDGLLVEEAADILRSSVSSPTLRAAVLEILAELRVAVSVDAESGLTTVTAEYERDSKRLRLSLGFDPQGYLRREIVVSVSGFPEGGVPPGTTVSYTKYGIPTLVPVGELP